ncbi:MAG: CRTAC1 family protein [Acidobacteria bacterium]|nr:CRTAC1 family protein [Acidobacteriota bacterium]
MEMRGLWFLLFAAAGHLPEFTDVTMASGIGFRHAASHTSQKYLIETMGPGVALLDFDGDGLLDVFFTNGARLEDPMPAGREPDKSDPAYWNRLYRNQGGGKFVEVTGAAGLRGAGYGMGAATGDYDNDGDPDLYVTAYGGNALYRNDGGGAFTDVTQKAGVGGGGWSASAGFLDYDRDGFLDLVVTRYLVWDFDKNIWCGERRPGYRSYCHPDQFRPVSHILYRNQRDGSFRDVTASAGFDAPGKGLGVAFQDFDRDGWIDVLVANDSFPQQLFRNRGDGRFEEVALAQGLAYDEDGKTFAGMGIDFADYDNDGWPDAFITALANQRYAIFRNIKGSFEYASGPSLVGGHTMLHSGWGTRFFDYDNDGWKDLFVAQSHVMDNIELTQPSVRYLEPPILLRNRAGKFDDVSSKSGGAFRSPVAARGAAFGDLDNDGAVDIVMAVNNGPALVLRNTGSSGHHWLMVNTVGTAGNRDGIGARLRLVSASGREQHAIVTTASSYLSAGDKRVHFGLGAEQSARLLEITWPSGAVQRLSDVKAGQILTVREPAR